MTNWIYWKSSGTLWYMIYRPSNVNHFQHRPKWWNVEIYLLFLLLMESDAFSSWFSSDMPQTPLLLKMSKQHAKQHHRIMAFKTFKFDVDLLSLWELVCRHSPMNRWLEWKSTQYAHSVAFTHVFSILWDLPLPNTIHEISTYQLCWIMEHKIVVFLL